MRDKRPWSFWIILLLAAAALRFVAPDWDGAIAAHPDERFLIGAAYATPLLGNVCRTVPDFPYGHLPVTVARLFMMSAPTADPLFALRLLSGLIGVWLVALAAAAGRLVGGRPAAQLAAVLVAAAPFLIQQAHFYTVDPLAAALISTAVLMGARRRWWMAGVCAGLGVATKATVAVGLLPLLAVRLHSVWRADGALLRGGQRLGRIAAATVPLLVGAGLSFVLASPWALMTPLACWRGPLAQSLMATGRYDVPYTRQYVHTWPYLYPLVQMGLWGLGPLTVLCGLVGLVKACRRGLTRRIQLVWWWTVLFFGLIGATFAKFPRYMLPLYPWWAAWAAYALLPARAQGSLRTVRVALAGGLIATTLPLGLAQVGTYTAPHPWIAASRWLYGTLPAGATIAVETWDHPLPVDLPAGEARQYHQLFLPVYERESEQKLAHLDAVTEASDVVVWTSRRGYNALSRQPERYRSTLSWYRRRLDTDTVHVFTRCPRIGPVALTDDPLTILGLKDGPTLAERCGTALAIRLPPLDESFRVYDAPTTVVLTPSEP